MFWVKPISLEGPQFTKKGESWNSNYESQGPIIQRNENNSTKKVFNNVTICQNYWELFDYNCIVKLNYFLCIQDI